MEMLINPTAIITIEPNRFRARTAESHSLKVVIKLGSTDGLFAAKGDAEAVAIQALEAGRAAKDFERQLTELSVSRKGKGGVISNIVSGVEGVTIMDTRPDPVAINRACAVLIAAGYRVAVREIRKCSESGCVSEATVEWNREAVIPSGWYGAVICGKHNYRTCRKCNSTYLMSSMNSEGQAPSLDCEVCGEIIVEWGSSKVWSAELVTKGESTVHPI